MYNVDVGVTIPVEIIDSGRPVNLTTAQAVDLIVSENTPPAFAMTVTSPTQGYAEWLTPANALALGFHRCHVRVTFDPAHVYHTKDFQITVGPLFGG